MTVNESMLLISKKDSLECIDSALTRFENCTCRLRKQMENLKSTDVMRELMWALANASNDIAFAIEAEKTTAILIEKITAGKGV